MAEESLEGRRRLGSGEFGPPVKGIILGLGLFVLGLAMIFAAFSLVPVGQRSAFLLVSSFGVMLTGVSVLVASGTGVVVRHFARKLVVPPGILDSFGEIEPDKVFETKKYLVFKKNDSYILLPKVMFIGIYFVRLFSQVSVSGTEKVRLPFRSLISVIRKSCFRDEVNGLSVAKARGDFVVPAGAVKLGQRDFQESYVKGPAVLYFVFRYDLESVAIYRGGLVGIDRLVTMVYQHPRFDLSDKFDKGTILKIMEKLSKEVVES